MMAAMNLAAALSLSLLGPTSSAVYDVGQLQFAGGWGADFGQRTAANASWVNLQFEVGAATAALGRRSGVPSLYSFKWTVPNTAKMTNR
eukprot:SAG31_NODE_3528_length_4153_cov_1.648249_6_plen_89_part_00